jgi:subtilisin family serine protease
MRPLSRRAASAASVLCAVLLAIASVSAAPPAVPAGAKLMGDLSAVLDAAAPGERIPVYFVLADQLEGDALRARVAALAGDAAAAPGAAGKAARRQATVRTLREHAARTQAGLLAALRTLEAQGGAARVRPLWIGNVVGADLAPAAIRALAARPEVVRVNWNPKRDVFLGARASAAPAPPPGPRARYGLSPLAPAGADGPSPDAVECGVVTMRAPEVWNELGNTGAGAVIAVIDTGVCWTHSDIADQIWVNPGEDINHDGVVMDAADMNGVDDDGNGFIDDLIGWNFDYNTNQPTDENSHGSHCAGTVAGDGTGGSQSGWRRTRRSWWCGSGSTSRTRSTSGVGCSTRRPTGPTRSR